MEPDGATCKPNISGAGRRRRQRVGVIFVIVSLVLAAVLVALHVAWYIRLSLFFPVAAATVSLLQVRRNTCVAHAAKGTFEREDFSTTKQSEGDATASRRVAATIYRDAVLLGVAGAALAAATIFVVG